MKLPSESLSSLQGKSLLPDPSRPSVAESGANIGQTFERMLMEVNRQHQEAEQKQAVHKRKEEAEKENEKEGEEEEQKMARGIGKGRGTCRGR